MRLSATEADAPLREAEANAAQIEARLGLTPASAFERHACRRCRTRRRRSTGAEAEFDRIKSLLDQRVVSQAEYDQRRTQVEAARQQYEAAQERRGAAVHRSLQAARARVDLARKALADTAVRAPFAGVVAERLVSTGDYVTKGMKVATVVRVKPLRVQLTVPEQFVSAMRAGQPVAFEVDAYPGATFEGKVQVRLAGAPGRPARADGGSDRSERRRACSSRACSPPRASSSRSRTPAVLVPVGAPSQRSPAPAACTSSKGDHVEERIVTTGEQVGDLVEIANGLKAGERVATKNVAQLADGIASRFES